jgi:transposase
MEKDKRLYPIDEEQCNRLVLPVIEGSYSGKGRPPKVSPYKGFCGIRYILRTGIPWRDLPLDMGSGTPFTTGLTAATRAGCGNKSL